MLRDLLSKLTGAQITIIALALIFVPGTVAAAIAFQPVAIVDPITGKQSLVDKFRRLSVYDPVAGYRNNPANYVEIFVSNSGDLCDTSFQYTVPAGHALVLTAIAGDVVQTSTSFSRSGFSLYDGPSCVGNLLLHHLSSVSSAASANPVAVDLGNGIVIRPGKTVSMWSINNYGYTFMVGYLVPASAVPATALDGRAISASDIAEKMRRMAVH